MKRSIDGNTLVMLHPMAPYIAQLMPNHVKGKIRDGSTTGFCKNNPGTMAADVDYKLLRYIGVPMTLNAMYALTARFVSESKSYGKRGGGGADRTARHCVSCLLKEKLIVKV